MVTSVELVNKATETPEIGKSVVAMGLNTNYHDTGSGHPIVLLHGSGPGVSAWANWQAVIPKLAEHCRVIAVDMAGYGYTELDEQASYSMAYWLRHLTEFLDALDLPRVSLLGNSFGGVLATTFAAQNPQRVERLALMGANILPYPITRELDDLAWGYQPSVENMRKLLHAFAYDKARITDEMAANRYQASIRPGYMEAYQSMFPAPRQDVLDAWALDEEDLRAIDCETLLIHGLEDVFVPVSVSIRAQQLMSRSQVHIYGQCGHWTQVEQNERFCKLVIEFFSEVQTGE